MFKRILMGSLLAVAPALSMAQDEGFYIGAGLVWLPAAIYLYAIGDWVAAAVLIVYGLLVIGLADNVLRPILVGRDTKLPDWMVLLSTLGGIVMVGIHGFVVGPLIAVLFVAFWQIFRREFYSKSASKADDWDTSG